MGLARRRGVRITIANRHLARAKRLVRWLKRRRPGARVCPTSLARVRVDGCDLLVNATTVGLRAGDPSPVRLRGLRRETVVYDLIYHRETALVAAARRRGCVAAGGETMLLYQGAESLRLWLNRRPPIEAMRRALTTNLRDGVSETASLR